MFPSRLVEFGDDKEFTKVFKGCLLNHGIDNRTKDLFFISYAEYSEGTIMCEGIKVKVLSSVSVLRGTGIDGDCTLISATKILYSTVASQDMQMMSLISQMSVTKMVTAEELQKIAEIVEQGQNDVP